MYRGFNVAFSSMTDKRPPRIAKQASFSPRIQNHTQGGDLKFEVCVSELTTHGLISRIYPRRRAVETQCASREALCGHVSLKLARIMCEKRLPSGKNHAK